MSSYEGYSEHYNPSPQVYQYDSSPIPKPAEYSDLEAVRRQNYPPNEPPNEKEQSQSRRICGLRVVTFWLALALVVVIILAAVGGGVGGALANNNSSKSAASKTTTTTVTATGTASAASSTVPSSGFARLYCTNETVYTTPNGARFKEYCAIDWGGGSDAKEGGTVNDLQIRMAGTYHPCMNQCASYNKNEPNLQPCKAIAYIADLTDTVGEFGGNCWFKSAPATGDTLSSDEPDPEKYAVAELLEE